MRTFKSRFFFLAVLCSFLALHVMAQKAEIERLLVVADTATGREKVRALTELSMSYLSVDPEKGVTSAKQALQLANESDWNDARAKIYNNMGANYIFLSQYDSARNSFGKALYYAGVFHDTLEMATGYNRLGVLFEKTALFDSALIVFNKSLALYTKLENFERMGVISENIGNIHLHKGELKSAITSLLNAKSFYEKTNSSGKLTGVYLKLGRVFAESADYESSLKWYDKGYEEALSSGDLNNAAIALNATGILFEKQQRDNEALLKYNEALKIALNVNNMLTIQAIYGNMGNVYNKMGDYIEALKYHQKGKEIALQMNWPLLAAQKDVGIGLAYKGLNDYHNARKHYEEALPVMLSSGSNSNLLSVYENLITINTLLLDYKKAVEYYDALMSLKDTLNKTELNTALDSLKIQFKTEQTLHENLLLSQQNIIKDQTIANHRLALLFAILFTILLITLAVIIFRSRIKIKNANWTLEEKNKEISRQADELREINHKLNELSEFKDSMNSFLAHDLKNPLNAIINYNPANRANDGSEIKQIGLNMLNIVSNMLDISRHDNKAIRYEQEHTSLTTIINSAFHEVHYLASSRSIRLKLDYAADIFVHVDQEAVKRVFVNLFTNAIKYSRNGSEVRINAEPADEDFVLIKVIDQGAGIDENLLPFVFDKFVRDPKRNKCISASSGIGLTYCKMAVELHGGTIGVESSIGKGSCFWFTLPVSIKQIEIQENIPTLATVETEGLDDFHLSDKDKIILQPVCENLRKIKVYQITDVREKIIMLKDESPGIKKWKQLVNQALNQCNETKYDELININ